MYNSYHKTDFKLFCVFPCQSKLLALSHSPVATVHRFCSVTLKDGTTYGQVLTDSFSCTDTEMKIWLVAWHAWECTVCRCAYSSITTWRHTGSGQLHVPSALYLGSEPQVFNGWRAWWLPTDMDTVQRRKYLHVHLEGTESQFSRRRACGAVTVAKLMTWLFRTFQGLCKFVSLDVNLEHYSGSFPVVM
jgi:hypothetical protein